MDSGFPISSGVNSMHATVPSQEHAIKCNPELDQLKSRTLLVNKSCITTSGRLSEVNHTLSDRSRAPIAQQQYCCVFGLPGNDR